MAKKNGEPTGLPKLSSQDRSGIKHHARASQGAVPEGDQKLYFRPSLAVRPLIERAAWPSPSISV